MSQQALADKLNDWAIYAIRSFATLPFDLQITPFVSDEAAESERLTVKTEVGEQMDSGPEPFECVMSFTYQSTAKRTADEANDIFAKVEAALIEALSNAASVAYGGTLFIWLQIFTENAATNLEQGANTRKFIRTLPLRAR